MYIDDERDCAKLCRVYPGKQHTITDEHAHPILSKEDRLNMESDTPVFTFSGCTLSLTTLLGYDPSAAYVGKRTIYDDEAKVISGYMTFG